ncbi:MAG: acyltransferase [Oscillospiraceae bacterium]|nr:acyltransferase [Oscillospiraceae bacterium]
MVNILKKLYHRLIGIKTSDELNDYLIKHDVSIGDKTVFFDANSCFVDVQRPWMLKIGAYCKITRGTVILQHDYSRSVLRRVYGDVIDGCIRTEIGDNVFIGMNSVILMGSKIGNNVIVGAGSIVSGVFPDNCVIAGNPAKVIRTLDEHYKIRKKKYIEEAKDTAREYIKKYGKNPSIEEMGAFFPIYLKRDIAELKKNNLRTNLSGDEEKEVIECFMNSSPVYSSFEEFLSDL